MSTWMFNPVRASVLRSGNSGVLRDLLQFLNWLLTTINTCSVRFLSVFPSYGSNMFCWLSRPMRGLSTPTRRTTQLIWSSASEVCYWVHRGEFQVNAIWNFVLWTALPLVLCSQSASFHFPASLDWLTLCVEAHYSPSSFLFFLLSLKDQ